MRSLSLALLLLAGCASMPDLPVDYHQSVDQASWSGRGAWAFIERYDSGRAEGELLAIEDHRIHFLPAGSTIVVSFDLHEVRGVEVVLYDGNVGGPIGWSVAGAVSTLSHGYYMLFTAPVWIVSGVAMSHQAVDDAVLRFDASDPQLRSWARFPQGIPEGFELPR